MDFLVFRLYAPLASWGEPAVGEERPSATFPSASAVFGLIAAALGLRRDQEDELLRLNASYDIAVGQCRAGTPQRDYQTAQVPGRAELKKRPHRTRADELAVPKSDLHTILSTRDYREDGVWLVAIAPRVGVEPPYALERIKSRLERPVFTLYLGRKACPPALPLAPQIVLAETVAGAFSVVRFPDSERLAGAKSRRGGGQARMQRVEKTLGLREPPHQVAWPVGMAAGYADGTLSTVRKDRLISRRRWQFGDRTEQLWLASQADAVTTPEEL